MLTLLIQLLIQYLELLKLIYNSIDVELKIVLCVNLLIHVNHVFILTDYKIINVLKYVRKGII